MYELRTVDVWDTLLRRDCHPECIKLATARYLSMTAARNLKAGFQEMWSLYEARLDAERSVATAARQRGDDDEYEITDVLRAWLEICWQGSFDPLLPAALAEYELSVEIARTYLDPDILEFLEKYPAKKTMFLSDFYMDSRMLGRLLAAHQLGELFSAGISSCDVNRNKRSGNLFKHVQSTFNIDSDKHVHVGDNEWSDVDSPGKLGIQAIRFLPSVEHDKRIAREHLFSSRQALFSHVHGLCKEKSLEVSSDGKSDETFFLGVEAAPLFIGFTLWIAEQAVLRKFDKIIFLTREGEFFHAVYSRIFADEMFSGLKLPQSSIFPVSRISTFSASLERADFEEVSRAWSIFGVQRVSALFAMLDVATDDFSATLKMLGLRVDEVVENPSSDARLRALFAEPKFFEAVNSSVHRNKVLLKDLLAEHGIFDGMNVGVVDIGWRGTIQDNIALAAPLINFHGMYLGLRSFVNPQPLNVTKSAYGPHEEVESDLNRLFEVFSAMEMVCSSPHGSVVGYSREEGKVLPVREISSDENVAYFDFSHKFQQGVLFAAAQWTPYLNSYVVSAAELRESAMKVWEGFRRSPPHILAKVFMQTPQHDAFGFGEVFSRNNFPSLQTIFLSPFSNKRRRAIFSFVRRVQWTAAVDSAKELGWFHRKTLALVFFMANHLKVLRMKLRHGKK
ncbi:MAG: HAD family hydrolase [Comamonas sp.]